MTFKIRHHSQWRKSQSQKINVTSLKGQNYKVIQERGEEVHK